MLSITNCYRNEKQNHSKISSHSSLNAHQQKKKKNRQTVGSTLVAQWLGFWAFTATAWVQSWSRNWDPTGHVVKQKKKSLQTINTGEGMQKGEPSYTVARNENQYNHYREQCGGSLKH